MTSTLNAEAGTITIDLASLTPDALGEILRAHVYGYGKGYRDMEVNGPYIPVEQAELSEKIVDELLGNPEYREDWMKISAWKDDQLTIAYASDGDTSLLFQVNLSDTVRTIVNYDAKHDYGWHEI